MLDYFGTIQDILKVGFRSFELYIFDVKWFKVIMNGPHATVRRDKSGLIQVDSTKVWTDQQDTFVRPEHCEQVVFKADPKDPRWLFVVQVAPRSKQIYEEFELQQGDVDAQGNGEQQAQTDINEEEQAFEDEQLEQDPNEVVQTKEAEKHVEEEDIDDEDILHQGTFNDEDAEMYIEIDNIGATDLNEDDRIDNDF